MTEQSTILTLVFQYKTLYIQYVENCTCRYIEGQPKITFFTCAILPFHNQQRLITITLLYFKNTVYVSECDHYSINGA